MNKVFLLIAICSSLVASAQKKFDSTAYANFNANRWEKFDFFKSANFPIAETLTTEEKLTGLGKCWSEAKYNFANFDLVPQLNWDSLYTAFIPKVMATQSVTEYYHVLQHFYQYLRDGHTRISLPFAYIKANDGKLPIKVRWIENRAVVVENNSNRAGEKSIKVGDELIAINGKPLTNYIRENVSPYLHFSTVQDSVERIYRYELFTAKAGEQWALSFRKNSGVVVEQPFLFEKFDLFTPQMPLLQFIILPGNIGYVQLNSLGSDKIVQQFDSIFPALSKTSALILDVRNNGGGNGGNGFELLGYLTDKPFYTGKAVIRKYRPVGRSWGDVEQDNIDEDNWKPYKNKLYNKPVAVLTSGATYSAAEDFTATYKNMKRGAVIGEPTGGSTGQPVFFMLPGGGFGAVCSKRDLFSDGTEFVGIGIQPDILVHPTLKGLATGKDDVLDAAVNYIKEKR